MATHKIDELFRSVKTLPSIPVVVQKIFASINNPNIGAKQLAEMITADQTLTTRVLKLANSSFFSLRGKIQNIHNAVTMLGFSTIRQICLGVSVCSKFKNLKANTDFTGTSFWIHSIAVATIARAISKSATKLEPDVCYTVGLIHDIGKLLLVEHHRDRFAEALSKSKAESIPLQDAEREIFGVDHAEIGGWLFRKWNLPHETRRPVKNHHTIDTDMVSPISQDALTGVLYFANQLAHHMRLGNSGNLDLSLEPHKFKKFFGMDFEEMKIDRIRLEQEVQITLEILGIGENAVAATGLV
jgi:putative nucleotidyltransferase with HDIG domain